MKLSGRHSFTLLELLIGIVIIGILATLAMSIFREMSLKAKLSEAYKTIGMIRNAQEAYHLETGKYSDDISELDVDLPDAAVRYFLYAVDTDTGITDPPGFQYNDYIIVAHPNTERPGMSGVTAHIHIHSDGVFGRWESSTEPHSHGDYSHTHSLHYGNPY